MIFDSILTVSDQSSAFKTGEAIGMVIGLILMLLVPAAFLLCLIQLIRTGKRGWLIGLICSTIPLVLILGLMAIAVYEGIKSSGNDSEKGFSTLSVEGSVIPEGGGFSLEMPEDWKFVPDLHDEAGLEAGNPRKEEYMIVLSEPKANFGGDLKKFSEITIESMAEELIGAEISAVREVSLDGLTALQGTISGQTENINIVYLHTSVETETRYHQIIGWTLKSEESVAIPRIKEVILSLNQVAETEL